MENPHPGFQLHDVYNIVTVEHSYVRGLVHKNLNVISNQLSLIASLKDSILLNDSNNERFIIFGMTDECVLGVLIKYFTLQVWVDMYRQYHASEQ